MDLSPVLCGLTQRDATITVLRCWDSALQAKLFSLLRAEPYFPCLLSPEHVQTGSDAQLCEVAELRLSCQQLLPSGALSSPLTSQLFLVFSQVLTCALGPPFGKSYACIDFSFL